MCESSPAGPYGELLFRAQDPDPAVSRAARDELVGVTRQHLVRTARRMLRGFRRVKRWCDTDDVVQEAALRLHRALAAVPPTSTRNLLGLAALQVRRELLDLAKRFGGPRSLLGHLDTNVTRRAGHDVEHTALAATPADDDFERWVVFHEVAAALPEADRQMFDMIWYLGASQDDVARAMGCSHRTVRCRWESVKARFLAEFNGRTPDESS